MTTINWPTAPPPDDLFEGMPDAPEFKRPAAEPVQVAAPSGPQHRRWAEKILAREKAGDMALTAIQITMAHAAMRN